MIPFLAALAPMLARVGGGGGYSGGGGGDGGGGDAGLVFALVRLLLWLVFRHPLIGIPVVIVVVIVVVNMAKSGRLQLSTRERPRVFEKGSDPISRKWGLTPLNLTPVRSSDPNFSEPAFLDFAQLVFARAHEMRGTGRREPLEPWMAPEAIDKLFADRVELSAVGEVIVGSTRIERAFTEQGFVVLDVAFEANVAETRHGERSQVLCEERWAFRRKTGVVSPPPSRLRALGCPSCGSTLEPRPDGTCASCGTPRRGGLAIWEVASIPYASRRPLTAPELRVRGGGVERGTDNPTRYDPRLQASRRAFEGRHPDHAWPAFEARVREVFLRLQAAWSTQDWEKARSDETDALYQTHRFWMERYRAFGLRNRVGEAEVSRVLLTRIDTDAYYESITVRIFASARDWTERADGTVVSGDKSHATTFSEYWTFLRGTTPDTASRSCPSCAAPLDASLGPAAVCPYCGAKLESASARWVVSRIEQD